MMKFTKFANGLALVYSIGMVGFLVGCVDKSRLKVEEIPEEVVEAQVSEDSTPAKRPPNLIRTTTLLLSEVDGCKTYMVIGKTNYYDNSISKWNYEWVKTYFTKCVDNSQVTNKWEVREGKQTVEKSSTTETVKQRYV